MKFIRSIKATKDEHTINLTTQPYCVGMYTAVTDSQVSRYLQFTHAHKSYQRWSKKLVNNWKEEGYTVEVYENEFENFLSKEDIDNYVKLKQ